MQPHPDFEDFVAVLKTLLLTADSFSGILYRACDPLYANTRDLLTGEGSRIRGGRWNPPRSFPTVYLAQSVDGAIAEALGLPALYGFNPASRLPLTLVAIEATLGTVLDFTDAQVRASLAVKLSAMRIADW